jgi:hypothetical protein
MFNEKLLSQALIAAREANQYESVHDLNKMSAKVDTAKRLVGNILYGYISMQLWLSVEEADNLALQNISLKDLYEHAVHATELYAIERKAAKEEKEE